MTGTPEISVLKHSSLKKEQKVYSSQRTEHNKKNKSFLGNFILIEEYYTI